MGLRSCGGAGGRERRTAGVGEEPEDGGPQIRNSKSAIRNSKLSSLDWPPRRPDSFEPHHLKSLSSLSSEPRTRHGVPGIQGRVRCLVSMPANPHSGAESSLISGGPRGLDRKPGAISGTLPGVPHAALRWGSEPK